MDNNYLSPASFLLSIDRLPRVEFTTQKVNIPGISAGFVDSGSPIAALMQAGGKLTYDDLNISFLISENMENYLEILNWFTGINTPQDLAQYRKFDRGDTLKSDITVVITNSHKNSNMRVNFYDCFPIAISDVQLDVTSDDVAYPEANVTFKYNYFTIDKL